VCILSSLRLHEIKLLCFLIIALKDQVTKGNMEVIICSVYITHIVTGKVLSPSYQQLVTECVFLYILMCLLIVLQSVVTLRLSQ